MTRDEAIKTIGALLHGLEMPLSLGVPLGTARDPFVELHREAGFGYLSAEKYEAWLREVLA